MSLIVTEEQARRAARGEINAEESLKIIRISLPYAYGAVERLADAVATSADGVAFDQPTEMSDADRGQLLRLFASTSMRGAMEQRFGIRLAFQNCHAIGGGTEEGTSTAKWAEFTSMEGQVRAQQPSLVDC